MPKQEMVMCPRCYFFCVAPPRQGEECHTQCALCGNKKQVPEDLATAYALVEDHLHGHPTTNETIRLKNDYWGCEWRLEIEQSKNHPK